MISRNLVLGAALWLSMSSMASAESVGVSGSNVHYPTVVEARIGGQSVKLRLTGAALRKKYLFNVYTIASYVQEGAPVRTGEELIAVDCCKRLHLVMERDVTGKEMAEAFRSAIKLNYPNLEGLQGTIQFFADTMTSLSFRKGDHIWLTHVPRVGTHIEVAGKGQWQLDNLQFSTAIWQVYLGKKNLDEGIKQALLSRLAR